jgi:membrane-bound metal-dependent hydrolase YbcI (DUF457 family)
MDLCLQSVQLLLPVSDVIIIIIIIIICHILWNYMTSTEARIFGRRPKGKFVALRPNRFSAMTMSDTVMY